MDVQPRDRDRLGRVHVATPGYSSGVAQQDLKVSVQNNQLILEGERKAPETFKNHAHAQLAYGKFYAAVTLPTV